jgi:hypothetical protein
MCPSEAEERAIRRYSIESVDTDARAVTTCGGWDGEMRARPLAVLTTARTMAFVAVSVAVLGTYSERWHLDILAHLPVRGFAGVGRGSVASGSDLVGMSGSRVSTNG